MSTLLARRALPAGFRLSPAVAHRTLLLVQARSLQTMTSYPPSADSNAFDPSLIIAQRQPTSPHPVDILKASKKMKGGGNLKSPALSKAALSFVSNVGKTVRPNPITVTHHAAAQRAPFLHAADWTLHNPVYTQEEVDAVRVIPHEMNTTSDKIAAWLVASARWGFDFVTRYKHASPEAALAQLKAEGKEGLSLEELRAQGYVMTVDQWMSRIIFLEAIAGVPGSVAGVARHLRSLRLMQRDSGWIHSLLSEAENERMHLLSFLAIKGPSKAFRLMVIATQGVFVSMFSIGYAIAPSGCHAFVAALETEAVKTYSSILDEMDLGHLPEWGPGRQAVPQIAMEYWRLPQGASMRDMILAVRADEAGHRFLNRTLANLEPGQMNPFGLSHPDPIMQGTRGGLSKEESQAWSDKVRKEYAEATKPL